MASYVWAKIWLDVLDDPKMGCLSDRLWRRVIELILLAKQYNKDGLLPGEFEMSWTLRLSIDELQDDLRKLSEPVAPGLAPIIENKDGAWFMPKYTERQDAMTSTERVQEFRKRFTKRNDNETNRSTEEEVDIDTDTEKESGAKAPKRKSSSAKEALRIDQTPEGALMAQKLRVVYDSKDRRAPEYYANAAQREAYLTAFQALGSNLSTLLETAMARDITDRGRLLSWLQGCARKNGKNGQYQKNHIATHSTPSDVDADFARLNPRKAKA